MTATESATATIDGWDSFKLPVDGLEVVEGTTKSWWSVNLEQHANLTLELLLVAQIRFTSCWMNGSNIE